MASPKASQNTSSITEESFRNRIGAWNPKDSLLRYQFNSISSSFVRDVVVNREQGSWSVGVVDNYVTLTVTRLEVGQKDCMRNNIWNWIENLWSCEVIREGFLCMKAVAFEPLTLGGKASDHETFVFGAIMQRCLKTCNRNRVMFRYPVVSIQASCFFLTRLGQ